MSPNGTGIDKPIIHSIHCAGYLGCKVGFDDNHCDCVATIKHLTSRLAAAEAAARWWRMAARGYILEEGEVHPDERWPWLVDEAADEAAKGGRDGA